MKYKVGQKIKYSYVWTGEILTGKIERIENGFYMVYSDYSFCTIPLEEKNIIGIYRKNNSVKKL